ncbi:MAG: GNAT family N-acetyltransferase [Candidatus Sumerlaeia bacterium]|nr:GNAT family N-acetyltransferase [Candidatus Sumerlaeia bacterium]
MLDHYAAFHLACLSPAVRGWLGDAALFASARARLLEEVAERGSLTDSIRTYADACSIPGTEPADYAMREVVLGCGAGVLAQIQFYGLKRERPYISIRAQTRAFFDDELFDACAELTDEFAEFGPKCIRLRSPQGDCDFDLLPGVQADLRIYAGPLHELRVRPLPNHFDRIRLVPQEPGDYYDEYCETYDEFARATPELNERVARESLASLRGCHQWGACFRVAVDGEAAGVIAARPEHTDGLEGWVVIEEILAAGFRGRGFGAALQRHLIEELEDERFPLLIGTIDALNEPSLRTARRVGREDVGGWSFVPTRFA